MEWKLWDGDEPPFFTRPEFFNSHPWVPPEHQVGHAERIAMVVDVANDIRALEDGLTVVDIGCGDGSFLKHLGLDWQHAWGYDAGFANVAQARNDGLNVREADILTDELEFGDVTVITEVLEHLADPHSFVKSLGGRWLVATSPSVETDQWHYEHHAWAWDIVGYAKMIEDAGWRVIEHRTVTAAGTVVFGPNGDVRHPVFQCVVGVR